jgi:hypothetical protein
VIVAIGASAGGIPALPPQRIIFNYLRTHEHAGRAGRIQSAPRGESRLRHPARPPPRCRRSRASGNGV